MNDITLIMAYYENPIMLQAHLAKIEKYPEDVLENLKVIVVDDGSPFNPAEAWKPHFFDLSIYRIKVDIRWNQDACRNIGVHHTTTKWILLTDIDHMVPEETMKILVNRKFDPAKVYKFSRVSAPNLDGYKPHPNSWFMTKETYDRIGGYDERFAGYYGTDGDFRDRVVANAKIITFKEILIRVPREVIPDASTTTYQRKAPEDKTELGRLKEARDALEDQTPLRLTFPYEKVI